MLELMTYLTGLKLKLDLNRNLLSKLMISNLNLKYWF